MAIHTMIISRKGTKFMLVEISSCIHYGSQFEIAIFMTGRIQTIEVALTEAQGDHVLEMMNLLNLALILNYLRVNHSWPIFTSTKVEVLGSRGWLERLGDAYLVWSSSIQGKVTHQEQEVHHQGQIIYHEIGPSQLLQASTTFEVEIGQG